MTEMPCENCYVTELSAEELATRRVTRVDGGWVELTSGAIVACDPVVQPDRPAFARRVPPGRYAVELYASHTVGVAAVRIAPGAVARWELALLPGEDPATLEDDEIFGFGVDTGLAAFLDAETSVLIAQRAARGGADFDYYDDALADELDAGAAEGSFRLGDHRPTPRARGNAIVFDAGLGDGFYGAYWGLSARDEPLVLAVDLDLFDEGFGIDVEGRASGREVDALTPAQYDAMVAARDAIERDDLAVLEALLLSGAAHPERIIPQNEGTLTYEAVRLDRPRVVALLARYGARATMPPWLQGDELRTYMDYARLLAVPRSAALLDAVAKLP